MFQEHGARFLCRGYADKDGQSAFASLPCSKTKTRTDLTGQDETRVLEKADEMLSGKRLRGVNIVAHADVSKRSWVRSGRREKATRLRGR
jgi:hypothetical protein